ncbi:MAG: TolC family protein [Epsilonproteobacteria bacterium]|nr:TolC family protein [Campylobacterota bacterium]
MPRCPIKKLFIFFMLLTTVSAKMKYNIELETITPASTRVSMHEAVQKALENRPNLRALQHAIFASRMAARNAMTGYYPQINLTSEFSQANNENALSNTTTLELNQLIYSFSGPLQQRRKAKKETDVTRLLTEEEKINVRRDVEIAFLFVWFQEKRHQAIQALYTSSSSQFKRSKHQDKLALIDKKDWLQEVSRHTQNISSVDTYHDELDIIRERLDFLSGHALDFYKQGQSHDEQAIQQLYWKPYPIKLLSLNHYYDCACKHHPSIKKQTKFIEIEKENLKIAQGSRLPNFGFVANTGFNKAPLSALQSGIPLRINGFHAFGFGTQWTMFDGLSAHFREEQARANKLKETLNRQQTVDLIKQQIHEKFMVLKTELSNVRTQYTNYIKEKNDFLLKRQEHKLGLLSDTQYDAVVTTWENARLAWIDRLTRAEIRHRELLHACGYPPELENPHAQKA